MSLGPQVRLGLWVTLLVLGLIISMRSYGLYSPLFFSHKVELPANEYGVIAFSSQEMNGLWFIIEVEEINVEKETANIMIFFDEKLPVPFGFQFPYNISNSIPNECQKIPDIASTYLWCTKRPEHDKLNLIWVGVVQRKTYSTYALVIPFSTGSDIGRDRLDLLRSKLHSADIRVAHMENNDYSLDVILPEGASMQTVQPTPDHFGRGASKLRFFWYIADYYRKGMHPPSSGSPSIGAQPTVYIEFISDAEQADKENRLFWSGLGFGISIPLIVSGLAELFKDTEALTIVVTHLKHAKAGLKRRNH